MKPPAARLYGPRLATGGRSVESHGQKPKFLDRLSEAMRSRHYCRRTERTYRHWVKRFIHFHGVRHPETMAEEEVNEFLTHPAASHREAPFAAVRSSSQRGMLTHRCSWAPRAPGFRPHPGETGRSSTTGGTY